MIKNKFLEKLGIQKKDYSINWMTKRDKKKYHYKKDIKNYGFSRVECWDLEYSFVVWLYSHLKMYKKEASKIIDLSCHKVYFKDKLYTQSDAMDEIIKTCECFLLNDNDVVTDESKQLSTNKNDDILDLKDAIDLFSLILPYMWW